MIRFYILLLFITILFKVNSQEIKKRCGIDFPKSVCVSEEINGDITLNWRKPNDNQGLFLKYELFSVESPFVPIISINNISNTTASIPSTFKHNNFFLTTSILCNSNEIKFKTDTTKILEINGVKIEEGIEQIKWNNNIKLDKNQSYIERKTNTSTWEKIDSFLFETKNFFDTIDICNKNLIFYRLGVLKNDCINYSNLISDTLEDKYQPNIPSITSIGFDTTNQNLKITWNKSKERDIQGYIIYQEINGLSSTLDTVLKTNNTLNNYYTIFNPTTKMISNYRIAAFDYCYSTPPKYQTSAQSTNFYSTILNYNYDVCSKTTNLTWNRLNIQDDIKIYRIFLKKNNKWNLIDSTYTSNYELTLEKFTNNVVTIETHLKSGHTFFSNLCPIYSKSPTEPKISYTNYATIKNNEFIELKHTLSPTTGLKQLALFKLNQQNEFVEIDKIEANKNEIIFKDFDVNPLNYNYSYYVQHVDSCGNYALKHFIQKTILLKENNLQEDSLTTSTFFNNYLGFYGGVNSYIIEKSYDKINFNSIHKIVSDTTTLFNHKIENKENFEGQICFRVKGIENINKFGTKSESYSNTICYYFKPKIFIPNSFTPTGKNPMFLPIINFAKINSYELTIYNRWGNPVFKSTDINEGWNGNYGVEECPNGLYMYNLKINDSSDKEIIKRGLINLIR